MNLKMARLLSNMTQSQFLKKVGIWQPRISAIEKGHHKPSTNEKKKIERALGTPVDWAPPKRFRRTNKGE